MKTCPKCGRVYGDELNFCLEDGTLLGHGREDPEKTEIFVVPHSVPTAEVPRPTEPSPVIPKDEPLPTIADFRPKREATPDNADAPRRRHGFLLNAAAITALIIFSLGCVGLILYETVGVMGSRSLASVNTKRDPTADSERVSTPSPTPTPTPTATSTPTPTPSPTPKKPVDIDNPQPPQGQTFPDPEPPDLTGRYYVRRPDDDTVLLHFDVFNQNGGDFQIRDVPDKLRGSASLHHTDDNYFIGYVDWYLADGSADEEELYICGNFDALCGKLPFESEYFIATHTP